jgi:hypothetical protein
MILAGGSLIAVPTSSQVRNVWVLAAAGLVSGCSLVAPPPPTTTTTTTTTTTAVETTIAENPAVPSTAPVDPGDTTVLGEGDAPCSRGSAPFTQDGTIPVAVEPGSDAAVIDAITWETHEACTRLAVTFTTASSSPAVDPPEVRATFAREAGVVQLRLGPTIEESAIAHQVIGTELVDRVYVVRQADGSVSVDVHLSGAVFVRASTETSPARVVLDLLSGGAEPGRPARRGADVVVVEPTGGSVVYPITMSGYLAPGVDDLVASLVGPDGSEAVIDPTFVSTGGLWRAFNVVFPAGPDGTVTVQIGDLAPFTLDTGP